jgi:dipeptidyl aminopeptidase/acylaminoacyl peptidase
MFEMSLHVQLDLVDAGPPHSCPARSRRAARRGAVSGAGNHDNRTYGYFWGEKYQGLLTSSGGKDNYEASANYTMAANLKGKLLLMHGDMDNNVHPANTLRVVDALIKANKDFDLIIFPDAAHGLPGYSIRKQWDYFVRNLLGEEPPPNSRMMDRPPFIF